MNRRIMLMGLAGLVGCSSAGVSTDYLRDEVSAELAQVLINRSQLAPWVFEVSVDPNQLDAAIGQVRKKLTTNYASVFEVTELHSLRRFYSAPDGQAVAALAYAEAGGRSKPRLDSEQYARVETAFADPLTAQSVGILRAVLQDAFAAEFAFGV